NYYLNHPDVHRNDFGIAHFGKGLMFQKMGKYELAISEFKMAVENDMNLEAKVSDLAYTNMGGIYFKEKLYPEAVQAFSKAVESNPGSGSAHYWLGMSYLRSGDIEKAEKEAAEAKKLGIPFTALSEGIKKLKQK